MPSTSPGTPAEPCIYCKQCGYDLRACLDNRCSECGKKYDPADPKTFAHRPPRKRSWVKRGLAALLTLLVLLGGAYGWLYWEWHQEQQALAQLKGLVIFKPDSIGPVWLRKTLGPLSFVLYRTKFLGRYSQLGGTIPCAALAALKDVKWLENLDLTGTGITDLSLLPQLTRLQILNLRETKVTDISPLAKLTELRVLVVSKETITEVQVQELHRALPNCKIERR